MNYFYFRNIIGYQFFDASAQGMGSSDDHVFMNTIQSPGNGGVGNLVLTGEPESGDNVGYDTLYIAASISGAGVGFGTTVLTRGAVSADATSVPTDKGSDDDPDADLIFAIGDTIHSATDDVLGELTSIAAFDTNNQALGFSGGSAAVSDNEELFNVYPIKILLSFEK